VRSARKLLRRSARYREGMFLIEGPHCVTEALESPVVVEEVFAVPGAPDDVVLAAGASNVPITRVSDRVLRAVSESVTPQGVVAVAQLPRSELDEVLPTDLVLVLAGVRDPGNAGTLVRSAVAAGAGAVVFAEESVDPYSGKVVRSSAGALFRLPVVVESVSLRWADTLDKHDVAIVGADAGATQTLYEADLTVPVAVVIGNEAWGLPGPVSARVGRSLRIPMPGPAESLNAAVAGSILLFEVVRRRLLESASHG